MQDYVRKSRKPKLAVLKMKIYVRPIYTCARCGVENAGSTTAIETVIPHLEGALAGAVIGNGHMPIGWSSDYDTGYKCPRCK